MERPYAEVAKAQLEDVDQQPDWQKAIRELRQAIEQICGVLDGLEERVENLERGNPPR